MSLNIGHKITSVAVVVLVLMLIVAVFSIQLTARISEELEVVAGRQFPVTEAVARVNVSILEQGVILQRLFVLAEEGLSDREAAARAQNRFRAFGQKIDTEFSGTRDLLKTSAKPGERPHPSLSVLSDDLGKIESRYRSFEQHGLLLLAAREQGDRAAFDTLLPKLNALQDSVDAEIAGLRRHVEELTGQSVRKANRDEHFLLVANSLLTALAAILGFGVATLITRALVRSVRNLVDGTEKVEGGDLDTEVPVTSTDEVGRLTGSFNHMVGELRLKERIKDTFGKYVDPRIVSNLLDHPEFAEPGGERREMTVMFIDLKGFASISEALAPDDLVRMINRFFGHMTDAISENKGVVDKFMGDAVMAYWGPPFTEPDEHAGLACKAAVEALQHLERFREDVRTELGASAAGLEIDLRIGVSTGEMVVGTVGSRVSMNYTIMGDPVNLGSRLEGANKAYGTRAMISERTREMAGDSIAARELDLIRVKGKAAPTRVYELTGITTDAPALPPPADEQFRAGLKAYRDQDWTRATEAFESCLAALPDDPPSRVYLDRVAHLRSTPPPADWDGVWVFETK